MNILIKNIKGLCGYWDEAPLRLKGREMDKFPIMENAFLAIEEDKILACGKMSDWQGITDWRNLEVIDAEGKFVFPAWCDSHTHLVFAESRESEFEDRIRGYTYQQIAARGGGILNSAQKLAHKSEDALYADALKRLNEVIKTGTGAIEIKSGYGLSTEGELKMLRVIKRLKENTDAAIKATFLGAHALPQSHKNNKEGYLKGIIEDMLPQIAKDGLADYIDAFCEENYFTASETERLIQAGQHYGLKAKIHVNQFNSIGGVEVCTKNNALSVDHLEVMKEEDFTALENSTTIATALPSCSFFLGIPYAPAKEIIQRGICLALASDFNPGSTPSGNIPFVLSLACIKMKLTPAQAFNAITINGAAAMDMEKELGTITPGKTANIVISKAMSSPAYMPYAFGSNMVETVILKGKIQ